MNLKQLGSNKTELEIKGARVLFSYSTPVACESVGKLYRTSKRWSNTTTRHINSWLEGNAAEEVSQEFFDNLVRGV